MIGLIKTAIICITVIACLWIVMKNSSEEKGDE